MIGLNTAAIYILQTLGSLYLLIVLLRFILQLVRADFYNPLSQFIVRATKPLLNPLRRIIPGFGGIDLASLLLAILIQLVLMILILMLMGYGVGGFIMQLLIWSIIAVTSLFLKVFFFALIISVILFLGRPGQLQPRRATGEPDLRTAADAVPQAPAEPRRTGSLADLRVPRAEAD